MYHPIGYLLRFEKKTGGNVYAKTVVKKLGDSDFDLPHPLFLEGAQWKKKTARAI